MSWLSRQFARKEGGSRVGNIIRRVAVTLANNLTAGLGGQFIDRDGDGKADVW